MIREVLKKAMYHFGYELRSIKHLRTHGNVGEMSTLLRNIKLKGFLCNNIMDIGAHKAHWSKEARTIFPDASFTLVEPQKELLEYLKKFCAERESCQYFLAGAGAQNGKAFLTLWDDLAGSSFLPDEDDIVDKTQREVEIITIDHLIRNENRPIPDIIKLDVQGYELEALKGATLLFGKTEVFILEVSLFKFDMKMPEFSEIINFMLQYDYVVYDFPGFLRRPFDGALGQCDICFVKRNGFLRHNKKWK